MSSPTVTEQAIAGLRTIDIGEVAEGDIVFFSDGGTFQELLWIVNDPWMHAGIAVKQDGAMCTVEAGTGSTVFTRPLTKTTKSYETMAVARPSGLDVACVDHALEWATARINSPQTYAWEDFILSGLLLTTRRYFPANALGKIGEVLEEMAKLAAEEPAAADQSMTCSAFVHAAFNHRGGDCVLPVTFTEPPDPASEVDAGDGGPGVRTRRITAAGAGEAEAGGPTATADSGIALSDLIELSEAEQDDILGRRSLMELVNAETGVSDPFGGGVGLNVNGPGAATRAMHGSRVSWKQLMTAAKTVAELTARYITNDSVADGSPLQGRWVSPSDLWRCDELNHRAVLTTG